ncbi:MAG: hypothetical protein PHC51_05085 [bacterium]|nr:hypothetical protein [bacterium]
MKFDPQILFLAFFAFPIGFLLYRIIKHGGFKAAMFGAPIESTVGEVHGSGRKLIKLAIKVHKLGGSNHDKTIGLEVVAKTVGSYQMLPVSLSLSEARNFIKLLESAVGDK